MACPLTSDRHGKTFALGVVKRWPLSISFTWKSSPVSFFFPDILFIKQSLMRATFNGFSYRGALGTVNQFAVTMGILAA
jgi:hypothetical protein